MLWYRSGWDSEILICRRSNNGSCGRFISLPARTALRSFVGALLAILATASFAVAASPSLVEVDLPMPQELGPGVVAVILYPPKRLTAISRQEFQRARVQTAVQLHFNRVPKQGQNGYYKVKALTLINLVEERWIEGQAIEMGVGVTPDEVATELGYIREQNFESISKYRRFLHRSHYTKRDVHELIKVEMLKAAIQQRVLRGIEGKKEKHRALAKFIREYASRWRSRTVCAPGYVTRRCFNADSSNLYWNDISHGLSFRTPGGDVQVQTGSTIAF